MKAFLSNGITLIILAGLLLQAGWAQAVTTRVSVDSVGNRANNSSYSQSLSADGRFVAFASYASNLVAGDTNGTWDIFVHDRQTSTTTRVSVNSAGGQAYGSSYYTPSLSADGRFVAFASSASNLVAGDTNGVRDTFVHDRQSGTTTRVSVDSAGNQANFEDVYPTPTPDSSFPSISADGRFVAFHSSASNLVPGDTNGDANGDPFSNDTFVHDRQTGATTRVSVDSAGGQANGDSYGPSISADGRFVAFASTASNLVPGDTNEPYYYDIFVHDRQSGATTRVNVDSAGGQVNGDSRGPSISADGRLVAFSSSANNLVAGDTNSQPDIFLHDRQSGATTRVSVDGAGGQGNSYSYASSLSADGRFVAFVSEASNLVANDTNGQMDIFVHQLPCGLDSDCDGTPDIQDNCLYVPNGPLVPDAGGQSQRDTNGDGFGNLCDPDLNNDGRVTAADYAILRSRLNTTNADADLNGDGQVTSADYLILRGLLNQTPGPSGLVP